MLHILATLPALALLSPAPTSDVYLPAALPADTFATIHIVNPRELLASRETNQWVGFAFDAEWDRLLGGILHMLGDDIAYEEIPAWRTALMGAFADSTGSIFFVSGEIVEDGPEPTVGLLVKGGEETARLLRRFIADDAKETDLGGGRMALLSHRGRAEFFFEGNGLVMVASAATPEQAAEVCTQCLDSLDRTDPAGPLGRPEIARLRSPNAAFEFAVNLDPIWALAQAQANAQEPFEQKLLADLASMNWMYGTGELGMGEVAEWNFYAPYGAETLLGQFFGFFGEANKALLKETPAGAISASVGSFDVPGFADWVFEVIESASEDAHAQAVAGVNLLRDSMGIDLMTDVLGNMTGDFLGFSGTPSDDELESLALLGGMGQSTLIAMVEDADPLIDIVEQVIDISGAGAALTSDSQTLGEDREMEIWRSDPDATGFAGMVGVGDGKLILSTDPDGTSKYLQRLSGSSESASFMDDEKLATAAKPLRGSIISIQPTAAAADMMDSLAEMLAAFDLDEFIPDQDRPSSPGEARGMVSISDAFRGVAGLFRMYFEGTTTTEFQLGGGLVRIKTSSR